MMTPQYNTKLFSDIFPRYTVFWEELTKTPFSEAIKEENVRVVYYLLYAKYGNNPIANMSIDQFKLKVFALMYEHGPVWERKMEIQDRISHLKESELIFGGKSINNRAYNPGTAPSTSTLEELIEINEQTSTNVKKSIMDAYTQLWDLLDSSITEQFINRFAICFKMFVKPEHPVLFEDEEE